MFSGVLLQGTASGGKGLYCQGNSNTFVNLVIDGVPGNHIELTTAASGNVFLAPSVALSKVFNNGTGGARNTIYGAGTVSGRLGQPFVLSDMLTGPTTLSLAASGSANGQEISYNDRRLLYYVRLTVQNGGSAAFLSLSHGKNVAEQWRTDLSSTKYANLTADGAMYQRLNGIGATVTQGLSLSNSRWRPTAEPRS